MEYVTETNVEENDVVVQSIEQTHIANMLYTLLILETGYINGLMEKRKWINTVLIMVSSKTFARALKTGSRLIICTMQ